MNPNPTPSSTPTVTFSFMELVKLGTIVVAIAAAFFGLKYDVHKLGVQVEQNQKSIDHAQLTLERQDAKIEAVDDRVGKVTLSAELLREDLRRLGGLLYEKRLIRNPNISAVKKQEPLLEPEIEALEPAKRNPVIRALGKAGSLLIRPFRDPKEKETP